MENKVRFETLAELQETYPVGSVIHEEKVEVTATRYFYNKKDFNYLKRYYTFVEPVDDVTCFCRRIEYRRKIVEGYIYDGNFWYPAHNTWDGWVEYTEYDLKSEEEKRKEWEEDENDE